MKQPGLGKKIAELRLEMGLTQSELADRCGVSLRTIQRIETAEVTPRSYTVKTIFAELDYPFPGTSAKDEVRPSEQREGRFFYFIADLFNLKTNTMKKISILSAICLTAVFGISALFSTTYAQNSDRVKKTIEQNNENFVKWYNSGDIASVAALYHKDACIVSKGCGKEFITKHLETSSTLYKMVEMRSTSVSVSDTIAVEKGIWKVRLETGEAAGGEYLVEWRNDGRNWLIMSESTEIGYINDNKSDAK